MAASTPLLKLPPELMIRISTFLTTPELGYFRRTCKQIEGYLFDTFAREFFTKRQFMIEQPSLEALVGIASHKSLAPFLQGKFRHYLEMAQVIISTHGFPKVQDLQSLRKFAYLTRDLLLATGHACTMLVEAFSRLPNLRAVGLRDYDGKGRHRDGENALWRSYGWSLAAPDFGSPRHLDRHEPSTLLSLLLYALGKSQAKLSSFEVFLRRTNASDSAFHLTAPLMQQNVAPLITGLKTLLLSLNDVDDKIYVPGGFASVCGFPNLMDFLQQTSGLEHLRLNFGSNAGYIRASSHLLALLGDDIGSPPQAPFELKHLKILDLGMVAITPYTLLKVVTKFTTLTSLSLWKTALHTGYANEMKDLWPKFLPELGKAFSYPENITSLTIGFATVCASTQLTTYPDAAVKFAGKVSMDSNGIMLFEEQENKVSYRKSHGSSVREWLDRLGGTVCVPDLDDMVFIDDSDGSDDTGVDTQAGFDDSEDASSSED